MIRGILRSFSYNLRGTVNGTNYMTKKPVEFDNKGDTLIYSNDKLRGASVFFPIPYSLGTWSTPLMAVAWYGDVLGLGIGSAIWMGAMYAAILPHCWYLYNLRFRIDKIWFVRGGYWKLETSGINNVTSYAYTESENLKPQSGSVNAEGTIEVDAVMNAEVWIDFQEMKTSQKLIIPRQGTVHNPELLQAMLSGFVVEPASFIMN